MANVVARLSPHDGPFTVYASAARTADPDTQEFEALGVRYSGLYVVIDMTAVAALESVTFRIQGVDRLSGKTYNILQSAALDAVATTVLHVGPGITAVANSQEDQYVPPIFRIVADHSSTGSFTYSVGGMLCP